MIKIICPKCKSDDVMNIDCADEKVSVECWNCDNKFELAIPYEYWDLD